MPPRRGYGRDGARCCYTHAAAPQLKPFEQFYFIMPSLDDQHYAAEKIARFAARFDEPEAYRQLVGYAALPLVLTPELVHYLRQRFLPRLSYVAEVDLLLSELCHESGYETYVMESGVRAAALGRLRQDGGAEEMKRAARLLFDYTRQIEKLPSFNRYEWQAQKWAALAFLDDGRVAKEITEAFCGGAAAGQGRSASAAEFLRLSRLAQELAPELQRYPELIEYATTVTDLLRQPDAVAPERIGKTYRVNEKTLPDLTPFANQTPVRPERPLSEVEGAVESPFDFAQGTKGDLPPETPEVGSTWTEPITGMEFVYVPPGRFMMGSPKSEEGRWDDESPVHEVHFDQGFYMGKYPVTQAEWQKMMGKNPSRFKGERRPVENVPWNDAQEFLKKLNARVQSVGATGRSPLPYPFRLPSEAEWEYACRAGTTTPFYFGETINTDQANYDGNYTYGKGKKGVYRKQTTDVGSFPPNAWGLYDMHGNVYEWCEDIRHGNYNGAPDDGSAWLESGGSDRVLRGGSWLNVPRGARSASRGFNDPADRSDLIGFRVVRVI